MSGSWDSLSLRVSMEGRTLSCQHHSVPRRIKAESSCPGGGRTKVINWSQGNTFLLHLAPRKAHPGLCPNPQVGTQVNMMSPPNLGAAREASAQGLKDRENSGHFHPHLDNRALKPQHSPIRCLHVNKNWHLLTRRRGWGLFKAHFCHCQRTKSVDMGKGKPT